jgi:hypothetical protein
VAAPLHFQTTVSTSAVVINGTQHQGYLLINTHGTNVLYLGGTGVTTGTGFPIQPGQTFSPGQISHLSLTAKASDIRLFGIASGAGTDVRVLIPGRTE